MGEKPISSKSQKPVKESAQFSDLLDFLDVLAKKGKQLEVKICPRCKSPQLRRAGTMSGDMTGHRFMLPSKYECKECQWQGREVLKVITQKMKTDDDAIFYENLKSKE